MSRKKENNAVLLHSLTQFQKHKVRENNLIEINMESILIRAAQLVLSLSILVVLHELGHYLPAKWFKTKVEKFFLFFDWPGAIVKKKIGETVYGVGMLPLGGYVKIAGMIDESMDREQMKKSPEPWEFRSKPAWQRLIIMIGGVTVNVLLAFFIYAMVLYTWGEKYLLNENVKYGIVTDSIGHSMGFRNGDKILRIDGKKIERFSEIQRELILGDYITVLRNEEEITLPIDNQTKKAWIAKKGEGIIQLRIPYDISFVKDSSEAQKAGLQIGDRLVSINSQPMLFADEFLATFKQFKGDTINLGIEREGVTMAMDVNVFVPKKGIIGIAGGGKNQSLEDYFEFVSRKVGFFESIPMGVSRTISELQSYIRQFGLIFNREIEGYKQVGGIAAIGSIFPTFWDWQIFWNMTAFLSIMLAFLNLLPIPALDGGHVIFVIWEMISGKKPPQKILEYAQIVGFVFLLALLIYANGNDIYRFLLKD